MRTDANVADGDTPPAAPIRETAAAQRSDVDAWCAAGGPSAYSSKGDPGAVRR